MLSVLLVLHIVGGSVGIFSGFLAMVFQKGSLRHIRMGKLFVISMMIMSLTGAYIAFAKSSMISVVAGLLTFYLVSTAWITLRRADNTSGLVERTLFYLGIVITYLGLSSGIEASMSANGLKDGFPAGIYYFFGVVMFFAVLLDLRVVFGNGVSGAKRLVRHVWRMGFALYMATSSFFLGQPQHVPQFIKDYGINYGLVLTTIVFMFYWIFRVLYSKKYKLIFQNG